MSLVPYWFAFSVFAFLADAIHLWRYLIKKGANPARFFALTPGYLEAVYAEWCEKMGVSPRRRLTIRIVFGVNLLLSLFFLILFIANP